MDNTSLGYVDGKHFTEHVDAVKALKREGRLDEAERLLLRLVEATEAENRVEGFGVAPWYYEQLAIVYSQGKEYEKELAILERYAKQKHAPGSMPPKLLARLERLRAKNAG